MADCLSADDAVYDLRCVRGCHHPLNLFPCTALVFLLFQQRYAVILMIMF